MGSISASYAAASIVLRAASVAAATGSLLFNSPPLPVPLPVPLPLPKLPRPTLPLLPLFVLSLDPNRVPASAAAAAALGVVAAAVSAGCNMPSPPFEDPDDPVEVGVDTEGGGGHRNGLDAAAAQKDVPP